MNIKQRLLFSVLMSLVLSALMTAWVTFINLGPVEQFYLHWVRAFVVAWPAAGVISFVFGPWIQRLTLMLTRKRQSD